MTHISENSIIQSIHDSRIRHIAAKVLANERITTDEGIILFESAELPLLGVLASRIKEQKNGKYIFFNRNIHIEPTNICIYRCHFCAYSRKKNEEGSWEYSSEQLLQQIEAHISKGITEVHIVGGVHPDRDINYYEEMLRAIRDAYPSLHIKAFTAVELDYMIHKAGLSYTEGLSRLKKAGLHSIPGGGAEIFDQSVRAQLCHEKSTAKKWLDIHAEAHQNGLPSNATMLYGHIESYAQRIDHLEQLRKLQDQTMGFNAFIPLKFRKENNAFSHLHEVTPIEDLRNYAVCRIFLDNFPHLKAYWPMLGKEMAQLAITFGADDLDGTIDDTTKIYTMAGVKNASSMTADEMSELIRKTGQEPVERDSLYHIIKKM